MPEMSVSAPISAAVLSLVTEARNGRLAVCAGAGLSVGTGLPNGSELAQRIHTRFSGHVADYTCDQPDHLPSVASAVAALPAGLDALQRSIVELAEFESALPNRGHHLFALLVAEGAIRFLTTNWDDCVERGWSDERERILAARDASEAEELLRAHVVKVHGCCTRPATLLVTESQLCEPPFWTRGVFGGHIQTSIMVFVGIGDVAPYVREQIEELSKYVDGAHVRVVSPSIVERWETSQWKTVLPELSLDRRIAMGADDFADELARGWLSIVISALERYNGRELERICREAFGKLTAATALSWMRRAADGWAIGESVVRSAEAPAALKAIGVLAQRQAMDHGLAEPLDICFIEAAAVRIGLERVEVLLARANRPTIELERVARRRAERESTKSRRSKITVLCSASMAEGIRRSEIEMYDVLAGEATPDDLISGPGQVAVRLLWADELLRDVA